MVYGRFFSSYENLYTVFKVSFISLKLFAQSAARIKKLKVVEIHKFMPGKIKLVKDNFLEK